MLKETKIEETIGFFYHIFICSGISIGYAYGRNQMQAYDIALKSFFLGS